MKSWKWWYLLVIVPVVVSVVGFWLGVLMAFGAWLRGADEPAGGIVRRVMPMVGPYSSASLRSRGIIGILPEPE